MHSNLERSSYFSSELLFFDLEAKNPLFGVTENPPCKNKPDLGALESSFS